MSHLKASCGNESGVKTALIGKEESASELFLVEIGTPLGKIEGQVTVDSAPMSLAELVPVAHNLTNIMHERALRLVEEQGKTISCGPGCSICCHQMVPVSPPEAFYLFDLIDSVDKDRRTTLMRRFERAVKALEENDMIDETMNPQITDDKFLPVARNYFRLKMPCPFLENDLCSIHPHRPISCRDYNVTSPPSHCEDPYGRGIEKVILPFPLSIYLARLTSRLTGWKPQLIPLTMVPRWVSENMDVKTRQWPGKELFQLFMSLVGAPSSTSSETKVASGKEKR